MKTVFIVGAKRTAIGNFCGIFSETPAPLLGAAAIEAAVHQATINPELIEEALMGCVLPAGLGQAPARQAILHAGLSEHCSASTVNKVCGSGLKTVMLAHDLIQSDSAEIVIAGGMENMTRAPYLALKARQGYRFGHGEFKDHMLLDGLEDAYQKGQPMGLFADHTARELQLSREKQDEFALQSVLKAQAAQKNHVFKEEITAVEIQQKTGPFFVTEDEGPKTARPEKIPQLKPAFSKEGTVTAANASSISDGAAACLLMSEKAAQQHHIKPLARIVGHASFAQAPEHFTTAPIGAIEKLLKKLKWTKDQVDLFEINEAFAVVTLACIEKLQLDPEKVNVHGGACVLGHPIGTSGTRILVTLIYALKQKQLKRGIATLCIGGGEAVAVAIEIC